MPARLYVSGIYFEKVSRVICWANALYLIIANVWIESCDKHQAFMEEFVNSFFVGFYAHNTVVHKCMATVSQQPNGSEIERKYFAQTPSLTMADHKNLV